MNATLFAVDSQTNIYANTNGTVITLNSLGVPFQTNSFCPVPSIAPEFAQRDSAGNFYFAGNFDGTNNFGGTNLVGGWINGFNFHPPQWQPGYPTCFLTKYAPNGTLLWATTFGIQAASNYVSDLVLNSDDSVTIATAASLVSAQIAQVSSTGATLWVGALPGSTGLPNFGPVRLTSLRGTNGGFLLYRVAQGTIATGCYTSSGTIAFNASQPLLYSSSLGTSGKPVTTPANEIYAAGLNFSAQPLLQKAVIGGGILWTQAIGSVEQWVLNGDISGNLYLSGTDGSFSEYNSDGVQIWTTNYTSPSVFALSDATGNRIVQFADNTIARLSVDPGWRDPSITRGLQPLTVFTGSNAVFSIGAGGTAPLHYYWFFNNAPLAAPDSPTLTIAAVTTSQGGSYYVVVSNLVNSVTSAPVQLQVKRVAIFAGGQMLTNGTYTLTNPVITIGSAFTNGSTFYTLDGSPPSSSSTPYSGPFSLNTNATIRAIGYSQDFSQSENADIVTVIVAIQHSLTTSSPGGGSITLNPPGGDYLANTTVTATAVPNPGWTFLYWTGDASGTNSSVNISMQSDQSIQAVFGTTLSTMVQGSGQVSLNPTGGLYPYGQVVQLTAVPQAGNSFGGWGNAAAGNIANPLYFTITNATPTVSSLFITNTDEGSPALAPSVVWRTNVNATLFAVDSQANVYANANGAVIKLNNLGVPFQTNSFCPVPSIAPGFALRDSAGNFYFAGNFDGTNDFGGKTIVGGWTNNTPFPNKWEPGYPTCYLAKYAPNGGLLWATRIDGLLAGSNVVSDLVLNSDDSVTIGIYSGLSFSQIAQFASTGTNLWLSTFTPQMYYGGPVKVASLHGTNGGFLIYRTAQGTIGTGYYSSSGGLTYNSSRTLIFSSPLSQSGKPVTTSANEIYTAGLTPSPELPSLQKAVIGGGILWTQAIGSVEQWVLNNDGGGNVYLSGTDGSFSKYNSAGTLIWTTNYASPCILGLADASGGHVVQFADNSIALLQADPGSATPMAHFRRQAGDGAGGTGFRFSLAGSPGCVYEVFSSTDMISWQSMGYVTNNTGDIQIVDPDATNHMQKFYRVSP